MVAGRKGEGGGGKGGKGGGSVCSGVAGRGWGQVWGCGEAREETGRKEEEIVGREQAQMSLAKNERSHLGEQSNYLNQEFVTMSRATVQPHKCHTMNHQRRLTRGHEAAKTRPGSVVGCLGEGHKNKRKGTYMGGEPG